MGPSYGFNIYVLVLVIIFLAIIYIAKTWPVKQSDTLNESTRAKTLLQVCSDDDRPCPPGTVCEGVCKKVLGQRCQSIDECESGATHCNGTCSNGPIGGLNQSCPCEYGLQCVEEDNIFVCKAKSGEPCSNNSDCVTKSCTSTGIASPTHICAPGLALGSYCTDNDECDSGNCSRNVCQYGGFQTNTFGSYCSTTTPCTGFEDPNSPSVNQLLTCKFSENKCVFGNRTLGYTCNDDDKLCRAEFECNKVRTIQSTNLSVCTFPRTVNNELEYNTCPAARCVNGYSCVSGTCKSKINNFCGLGLVTPGCGATLTCGSNTTLRVWDAQFNTWKFLANIDPNPINIKSGFGTLQTTINGAEITQFSGTEDIYVAYSNKVVRHTYNPNTLGVSVYNIDPSSWSYIIPNFNISGQGVSIDGLWSGTITYMTVKCIAPTRNQPDTLNPTVGVADAGCYILLEVSGDYTRVVPDPGKVNFLNLIYDSVVFVARNDPLSFVQLYTNSLNTYLLAPGYVTDGITDIQSVEDQISFSVDRIVQPFNPFVPLTNRFLTNLPSTTSYLCGTGGTFGIYLSGLQPVAPPLAYKVKYHGSFNFDPSTTLSVISGIEENTFTGVDRVTYAAVNRLGAPTIGSFTNVNYLINPTLILIGNFIEQFTDYDFVYTNEWSNLNSNLKITKYIIKYKRPDGTYNIIFSDELETEVAPTGYYDAQTKVSIGVYGPYITTSGICS